MKANTPVLLGNLEEAPNVLKVLNPSTFRPLGDSGLAFGGLLKSSLSYFTRILTLGKSLKLRGTQLTFKMGSS